MKLSVQIETGKNKEIKDKINFFHYEKKQTFYSNYLLVVVRIDKIRFFHYEKRNFLF